MEFKHRQQQQSPKREWPDRTSEDVDNDEESSAAPAKATARQAEDAAVAIQIGRGGTRRTRKT